MADLNADVRKAVELTEAQILAGGIKAGQSWQASDTKRRIMRSVDGFSYRYDEVETENVPLTDQANESFTGLSTNQSSANTSHVVVQKQNSEAISVNTSALANLASASGSISWDTQTTIPTTPTKASFTINHDTNNVDLLAFDDASDTINFKKADARYQYITQLVVMVTSQADKTITLTTKKVSDDSVVLTRTVPVEGGNNKVRHINAPTGLIDNTIDDNEVYVDVSASDDKVQLLGGSTVVTVSGAGTLNGVATDFGVTAGTNITIDEQTSYYTASSVVVAFSFTASATISNEAIIASIPANVAPYKNARGAVVTNASTYDVSSGFATMSENAHIYKSIPAGSYRYYVTYPRA